MRFKILFLLLFMAIGLMPFNLFAQQTNPCGVVAKMSIEGDSVFSAPAYITLDNASINATDFKFIVNGFPFVLNSPAGVSVNTGLTIVQLVAYNGNCTDTTTVHYFYSGSFPADVDFAKRYYAQDGREYDMRGLTAAANGDLFIYGNRTGVYSYQEAQMGILIRAKADGCIKWSRKLELSANDLSDITNVKESSAGSIFLFHGESSFPQFFSKLDASGNLLWTRALRNSTGQYDRFFALQTTPDDGAVVLSTPNNVIGFGVTRFSATGQILWQRSLDYNQVWSNWLKTMVIKDGFVYVTGTVGYNNLLNSTASVFKLNLNDGASVWHKQYLMDGKIPSLQDMVPTTDGLVLACVSPTGNPLLATIAGYLKIDFDGNPVKSALIAENYTPDPQFGPYQAGTIRIAKSGNSFYLSTFGANALNLQGDGTRSILVRLNNNLDLVWGRATGGVGQPRYYFNAPTVKDGVFIGGRELSAALLSNYFSTGFSVYPVDTLGNSSIYSCGLYEKDAQLIATTTTSTTLQWTTDQAGNSVAEAPQTPFANYNPTMRYTCPSFIDSCSFLKLTGQRSICNLNVTYTYRTHKNKGCGQAILWKNSPNIQVVSQSDSLIRVRFTSMGRHVIYASTVLACSPLEDSIVIIADSKTPPLNIGTDTVLCKGNTMKLRAGFRYSSYLWSNGATDSVITINQPGQYWLMVKDSCDNEFRDTITVSDAPPIPFSIGPDRVICAGDTVELNATSGFLNYAWSPSYRIDATSSQKVVVNPLVDTVYTAIAEKTLGCFAYDTVRIIVNQSTPINLGPDKSFCFGDSALITPGSGFNTYLWNNGSAAASLIVKSLGSYSVMVTNNFGCKSYDTLQVTNVFALPKPVLDKNSILCEATTRTLDAGAGYQSYVWNTGANSQTIAINGLGVYAVQVTDNNGCKGTDTTRVNFIQTNPAAFLPADTAICVYEKLTIKPTTPFSTYLWNDGTNSSSLLINKTGNYWLKVSDQYGCIGTDSITVTVKTDCLVGIFVPSAFTPNRDGKNDLFKPTVYGKIVKYEFLIYNRWGTIVFRSTEINQGWDGKLNRQDQSIAGYVWVVNYQFEGQPAKQQKGTVVLIR